MVIEWKEPPSKNRGAIDWGRIAEELKASPGQWALVATEASASSAYNAARRFGFKVQCVDVNRDRCSEVYAKWPVEE